MPEEVTRIEPGRGFDANYELECTPNWIRFQLRDPTAARLGFPQYLFEVIPHHHLPRLRILIFQELQKHGLGGSWLWDPERIAWNLWLHEEESVGALGPNAWLEAIEGGPFQ